VQRFTIFRKTGSRHNSLQDIDDNIYERLFELHETCRNTHAPGTDCAFGRALEAYRDPPDGDYLAGVTCVHLEDNRRCVERLKDRQEYLTSQHQRSYRPQKSTDQQTQEGENTGLFEAVSEAEITSQTWLSGTGEEQRYPCSSVSLVSSAKPPREYP